MGGLGGNPPGIRLSFGFLPGGFPPRPPIARFARFQYIRPQRSKRCVVTPDRRSKVPKMAAVSVLFYWLASKKAPTRAQRGPGVWGLAPIKTTSVKCKTVAFTSVNILYAAPSF